MSVSELNELMTYVVEGWMLFSAGFIGTTFVAFVSKRIQEDMEAAALAQSEALIEGVSLDVTEAVEVTVSESVSAPPPESPKPSAPKPSTDDTSEGKDEEGSGIDAEEAARLEEVAAVSEKLAKEKQKQSDSSSVSVST